VHLLSKTRSRNAYTGFTRLIVRPLFTVLAVATESVDLLYFRAHNPTDYHKAHSTDELMDPNP